MCQIMEDKKGDVMKIGEEWDMLMEKLKALQQSFNEERVKVEKDAETIQVLQKDLKLKKSARTAADNSTCLHSDIFEIKTDKSQDNESVLSCSTQRKLYSLDSDQNFSEQIAEEAVAESEVVLIQHEKYNTKIQHKKYNTHVQR